MVKVLIDFSALFSILYKHDIEFEMYPARKEVPRVAYNLENES
jgi:hypothetical protein